MRGMIKGLGALFLLAALAFGASAQTLGPTPAPTPSPGYFNLNTSLLPVTRQKMAQVRQTTGTQFNIAVISDSSGAGRGCGTGPNALGGARDCSWPAQLAAALSARLGVTGVADNWVGTGGSNYIAEGYYPNLVLDAGWIPGIASITSMLTNATTLGALTFTPRQAFNACDVYYTRLLNHSSVSVTIGGSPATPATIDANGTPSAFLKQTVTVGTTAAVQSLVLTRVASGSNPTINIAATNCYDTAVSKVNVYNLSWGGATTANFSNTTQVWSALNTIPVYAPHLTIISLQINDEEVPTDGSTYLSQYQSIITAAKATGDVILMTTYPIGGSTPQSTIDTFVAYNYYLAAVNNVPLIDLNQRFISYTLSNSLSMMRDTTHANTIGYSDIVQAVLKVLALQ